MLQEVVATGPPEELREAAREWLEVLAEDLAGEAEKLFLAADAAGAEELLLSALELAPGSVNIHQKLGKLFYAIDDPGPRPGVPGEASAWWRACPP